MENTTKFKAVIMTCDMPNKNGRTYPKNVIEDAIAKYIDSNARDMMMLGELSVADGIASEDRLQVHLQLVSHRFMKLYFEGNQLIGEGEILNTPNGQLVKQIGLDNFGFELIMLIDTNDDNNINYVRIMHIDLINKDKCAWDNSYLYEIERHE